MSGPRVLDLRGMRCPWPALRVGRAMREARTPLVAVADDPAAKREIALVATARGWTTGTVDHALGPGILVSPGHEP